MNNYEQIKTLPLQKRLQVLENIRKIRVYSNFTEFKEMPIISDKLSSSLGGWFFWDDSRQGHEYWSKFQDKLKENE